jgi:F420H(2)-dependent quinone reductase
VTPPRPILRVFWALHRGLRRLSGGRLGTSQASSDRIGTLFIHTTGRRSGKPRTNGLFYLLEGEDLVVVASNAGSESEPAWFRNLRAHPEADVEIAGRRRPVLARVATNEEAVRLWPRLDVANPNYADYRAKAGRPIPIVVLEPR